MKIEYIENINTNFPKYSIIRLFEFNEPDLEEYSEIIRKLIETNEKYDLSMNHIIKNTNCKLELEISKEEEVDRD